ncbi:hypothetical protein [Candidatus Bandiella numerosa]|uniref:hypothetical protein n=1 Tax=Candidatus Bandiella numerosa TaxID=2570586 RepID=UPI001F4928C3|nr:hypothetical protein [Candidatus Bandiella numerosa]
MKKFQLPLVLFFILIAIYLFGDFLPVVIKELFLSISLRKHKYWHRQVNGNMAATQP